MGVRCAELGFTVPLEGPQRLQCEWIAMTTDSCARLLYIGMYLSTSVFLLYLSIDGCFSPVNSYSQSHLTLYSPGYNSQAFLSLPSDEDTTGRPHERGSSTFLRIRHHSRAPRTRSGTPFEVSPTQPRSNAQASERQLQPL